VQQIPNQARIWTMIRYQQTFFIFSMQLLTHLEFRLRTLWMLTTSVCWILATCCFHCCVLMLVWSICQVLKVTSWRFQESCLERSCQVHLLLRKSWQISWSSLSSQYIIFKCNNCDFCQDSYISAVHKIFRAQCCVICCYLLISTIDWGMGNYFL
jgi:hypothetical protein